METDRRISKYSAGIWLIGFGIGDDFSVDPAGYVDVKCLVPLSGVCQGDK